MKAYLLLLFAGISAASGQEPTLATAARPIEAAATIPGLNNAVKKGIVRPNDKGVIVLDLPDSSPTDRIEYTLRDGDAILEKPTEKGIQLYLDVEKIPRQGPQYIKLKDFTARSVGQWMDLSGDEYNYSRVSSKKALYDEAVMLRKKIDENLTAPADQQDWRGLAEQYRQMGSTIGEAYMDETDSTHKAALMTLLNNLVEEGNIFLSNKLYDDSTSKEATAYRDSLPDVEKAFYRMNDNYRPEIYPMIGTRSSASVAIVRKGRAAPHGSGTLIGPNLVLTCRHNIEENSALSFNDTIYEIWLDREERSPVEVHEGVPAAPPPPPPRVYQAREIYSGKSSGNLDFCLLEIDAPAGGTGVTPLKINLTDIDRDTPVFVVGYPQAGYRTVHDSSWVIFPQKIKNKKIRGDITLQVANEFLLKEGNPLTQSAKKNASDKAEAFMARIYGKPKEDPTTIYRLTKDGEEYLGIESDTFQGDSGAPVMLRENGSVIGILFKGPADGGASAQASGRRPAESFIPGAFYHERVVPIQLIVANLDANFPSWRNMHVSLITN